MLRIKRKAKRNNLKPLLSVDGSYDDTTKSYSYGMVIMHKDDELLFFKKV